MLIFVKSYIHYANCDLYSLVRFNDIIVVLKRTGLSSSTLTTNDTPCVRPMR